MTVTNESMAAEWIEAADRKRNKLKPGTENDMYTSLYMIGTYLLGALRDADKKRSKREIDDYIGRLNTGWRPEQ